jgi:hypothetical protein
MGVFASAVVVLNYWNLTILPPFLAVERVKHQTFSYFVKNVTEVNQIVVIARFIIPKLEQTVVMVKPLIQIPPHLMGLLVLLPNVLA